MSKIGKAVSIDDASVDDLKASFRGELIRPADAGYDEHRKVWNGSIDRHPALIARCTGVADVLAAVRFARKHELLTAVRGGGHSFPGHSVCDDGIVIDLGPMKGIRVDPEARTVRAQAGVLLGELDREAQAFGLAVPAGIVTHTGHRRAYARAAAPAGSSASTGSRSTTCGPSTSSLRTASSSRPATRRTPTSSGACAAEAATLAS